MFTQRRIAARAALALAITLGLMTSFGVPVSVTVLVLCALVIQIFPGVLVMRASTSMSSSEQFMVGAVFGVVLSTLSHVVLFEIAGFRLGFLLPVVLIPILLRRTHLRAIRLNSGLSQACLRDEMMPFVISLFYLSRDFRWLFLPTGLAFLCLLLIRSRFGLRVAVVGFAALAVATWRQRPTFWWFIADDLQAFESISFHFLRFGAIDMLGPLGTLGSRYHVLTYQWSGTLSWLSFAEAYVILNRVLPILIAIGTSFLIWIYLKERTTLSFVKRAFAAVFFAMLVNYSYVSPSYVFGITILIGGFLYWTSVATAYPVRRFLFSFVFATALALTKSSNIPVVVFGLAALTLWSFFGRQPGRLMRFADGLGAAAALVLYSALYLFDTRTSRQIESFRLFGYAKQVVPEIDSFAARPMRAIALSLVTVGILVIPVLAVFSLQKSGQFWSRESIFALSAVPFAVAMAFISGNQANGYFVSSGLNLVHLIGLTTLIGSFNRRLSFSQHLVGPIICGATIVSTVVLRRIISLRNSGSVEDVWLRVVESSLLIPIVLGLLVACFAQVFVVRSSQRARSMFVVACSVALLAVGTRELTLVQQLDKGPELDDSNSDQALGTRSEQEMIQLVSDVLPADAILATNHFCGSECQGSEWFSRDLDLMGDDFNLPQTPSGYGGKNFRLSAESRRRVLLEGPFWLLINGYSVSDARTRMSMSLSFAEKASPEAKEQLKSLGVTHFVLHLPSRASTVPLDQYGELVERNQDFVILRI